MEETHINLDVDRIEKKSEEWDDSDYSYYFKMLHDAMLDAVTNVAKEYCQWAGVEFVGVGMGDNKPEGGKTRHMSLGHRFYVLFGIGTLFEISTTGLSSPLLNKFWVFGSVNGIEVLVIGSTDEYEKYTDMLKDYIKNDQGSIPYISSDVEMTMLEPMKTTGRYMYSRNENGEEPAYDSMKQMANNDLLQAISNTHKKFCEYHGMEFINTVVMHIPEGGHAKLQMSHHTRYVLGDYIYLCQFHHPHMLYSSGTGHPSVVISVKDKPLEGCEIEISGIDASEFEGILKHEIGICGVPDFFKITKCHNLDLEGNEYTGDDPGRFLRV